MYLIIAYTYTSVLYAPYRRTFLNVSIGFQHPHFYTDINVHENEAEVPRRDSSTGVLTKDPTIYTGITVYSANITSAVVILHYGARARMGRTRTNTSKLAPGNLQHWWTFSNAVAGGPQSSYGVIMTSIRSARPHLTSSRVIDLTCTLIIACRW